ncbi:hypothetical protein WJX72_003650 [[Myrmecia] bisecta]|uniref:CASTOR/POLLUX/SYM8 ion channel conserved domain-containing protein n=1 Tax=[Myrmecia] bisecta TaxID=41462 RepID=A0AAW1Q530_9CHLO
MLESVDEGPAPPETSDELDSVQSPASVWLPYKENTGASPKAQTSFIQFGPTAFRTSRVVKNIGLLMKLPGHIVQVIAFKAQQIMLGSTWSKLVAVFVVGIPAIAFGGALYSLTSGKSLTAGLISAYGALYKIPGVTVIGEVNAMTEMLMHVIWMVGTFTFAIVLGVVTEDIVNTVMAVRSGNYPVLATNHTLILNWNNQTVPLLKQIAIHKTERNSGAYKGPVVILADRDKEDMDAQLRSALKGFPMEWHTRKGAPYNIVDLQRVAAGQARTIILLDPATEQDPGKKQVAAVLGIQTARATTTPRPFLRLQPQTVAVQEPEDEKNKSIVQAARNIMQASAQKLRLTDLSGRRDMSVLLAHSAVAPGVASVYCTIVQQSRNGVEFYIKDFPELSGLTYGAARRCFDRAIICGYIATDTGALCINPPDSDMMHAADRFVALAATGYFRPDPKRLATVLEQGGPNSTRPATHVESSAEELLADAASSKAKSIVVAWWDDDISDLCNSLSMFAPKGTTVTIVSETKPEGFPDEKLSAKLLASCKFAHIQGDPAQQALLKKAGVANAHAIIVGGVDSRPPKEGDALTLSVILLLNDVMVASGRDARNPVHIVGTVRRPETVEVANFLIGKLSKNTVTAELLQPDELVSGMISQVAAEPDMGALLAGFLYNVEGQEIHLRRPSRYLLPKEQPTSFAQITELARQRKETAIGYITKAGAMTLAPSCGDMHVYTPADRVVVIAEE